MLDCLYVIKKAGKTRYNEISGTRDYFLFEMQRKGSELWFYITEYENKNFKDNGNNYSIITINIYINRYR